MHAHQTIEAANLTSETVITERDGFLQWAVRVLGQTAKTITVELTPTGDALGFTLIRPQVHTKTYRKSARLFLA